MEKEEVIKRKKRNFIIIVAVSVVSLSILKAYSNYKIEQINKNLRLRR